MMKKIQKLFCLFIFILLILIANISFAGTLSEIDDLSGLDNSRYPEYKDMLQNLKNSNPNYHFQIYYTGIDWTEAVTMEYQGHGSAPKNLVSYKGDGSYQRHGKWFCPICGQSTYDNGLYCASKATIEYMMDPRNSLSGSSIFQFKNLEYSDVSASDIQNVISSKYSLYSYINNSTAINAMQTASTNLNLNGFSILAKIINEQGEGNSALIKGNGYNGNYIGYYNFFNVGAYGNGMPTIIMNGLKYAYNHGWNSVENSIVGGAEFYKNSFIGKGQNTLYYQRFNVVYDQALFSHQYQQDVMGAETSATLIKDYYSKAGKLGIDQYFIIPVYENMPATKCSRPSTEENNDLQLKEAKVKINAIAVRAAPVNGKIITYLNEGENVKIVEEAVYASSDGNFWDAIVTETDGTYGYVNRYGIGTALPNYVFDAEYYYNKYPDLQAAFGMNEEALLTHFIYAGIYEGRVASIGFDARFYLSIYPDLQTAFGSTNYKAALDHYLSCGLKEGRTASYLFDVNYYLNYYDDIRNAFGEYGYTSAYDHFKYSGIYEGRRSSIILDIRHYLANNGDLIYAFGQTNYKSALEHFDACGKNEFRNSSFEFDANYYRTRYSKLRNYGSIQLIEYYIRDGKKRGNAASVNTIKDEINEYDVFLIEVDELPKYIFDAEYYYNQYPDLQTAFGKDEKALYTHFIKSGISEGRSASEMFDVRYYLNNNSDLLKAFGEGNYKSAYRHFIYNGIKEGRRSSSKFDVRFYLNNYPDLINAFGENNYEAAYSHYVNFGKNEGRICYKQ